ncbi:hypothetical protein T06_4953 [Trichinella sp. T6]|nr:hypothetical protein T06_4953 [Trichinella sp. T6]
MEMFEETAVSERKHSCLCRHFSSSYELNVSVSCLEESHVIKQAVKRLKFQQVVRKLRHKEHVKSSTHDERKLCIRQTKLCYIIRQAEIDYYYRLRKLSKNR